MRYPYRHPVVQGVRRRAIARNRRFISAVKAFGCSRCPENRPECLEFHHTTPLNRSKTRSRHWWKSREMSSLISQGRSLYQIVKELFRCLLLCANCHKVETFKNRQEAQHGI